MKRIVLPIAAAMLFLLLPLRANAQGETKKTAASMQGKAAMVELRGYVVDAMCAHGFVKHKNVMEKAAAHTRECALEESCSASGYGVVSDGKWYPFDAEWNKQAKTLIEKSAREKGLQCDVRGKMEEGKLVVASLKLLKGARPEPPQEKGKQSGS